MSTTPKSFRGTVVHDVLIALGRELGGLSPMGQKMFELSLEHPESLQDLYSWARPNPVMFDRAVDFRSSYFFHQLLSKADFIKIDGIDREKEALKSFLVSEASCRAVNKKFIRSVERGTLTPFMRDVITHTRRKIAKALGPFDWDQAARSFGFGPGATNGIPSRHGDAYYKFGLRPTTTTNNLAASIAAVGQSAVWWNHLLNGLPPDYVYGGLDGFQKALFTVVSGNKVVTVPKSAKTDRTIAAEPTLNGYIQRGIGRLIRARLKRVGVDLDDQTRNQRLALAGSLDGTLATIDLSAASDSVSLNLVRELLPADWVTAIEHCRSPRGALPSREVVTYEKVSSMGNTYTFELESLLFWGLSLSVCELLGEDGSLLGIYGDDIVVPVGAAPHLLEVLSEIGFQANQDKSFWEGWFRESCGKHYFRGVDVTPLYIRHLASTPQELISLANGIRLTALRWGGGHYCDKRFFPAWNVVRVALRKAFSHRSHKLHGKKIYPGVPCVPIGFGDLGLITNFDEATPVWSRSLQSWRCFSWIGRSKILLREDDRRLISALYALDRNPDGDRPTSELKPYLRHGYDTIHVTQWPSIGPWA